MASVTQRDVQDTMKCRICVQHMTTARVLSCGHTFCYQCFVLLGRNNRIKCPTCRAETPLAAAGVSTLPKNLTMIELIAALNEEHLGKTTRCAACRRVLSGKGTDEWFCLECKDELCAQCAAAHRGTKMLDRHRWANLATINRMKCSLHPGEIHTHICVDCDVAVCGMCVVFDHPEHEIEDVNSYFAQYKLKIEKRWVLLKEAPTAFSNGPQVDLAKIETFGRQVFAGIQSAINKAAEKNIAKIKEEQADDQEKLARHKLLFDELVTGLKNENVLETKMHELVTKSNIKGPETIRTSPQEALTNFKSLELYLYKLIDQHGRSQEQMLAFSRTSLPKRWRKLLERAAWKPSL